MVIINEKICDNAPECSAITVCPTGAIFWDEKIGKLAVNNDVCVSCRRCVTEGCPVGAIIIAETEEEYQHEVEQINADERTTEELFVERYGAIVIGESTGISVSDIDSYLEEEKIVFIEEYNDDSIQCLIHSIPVHEIKSSLGIEFSYYKCDIGITDDSSIYPALVIYYGSECLGRIDGYYDICKKDSFISEIQEILKRINK